MLFNIFISIIIVFFCLTVYALFAPLLLEIDTRSDVYQFRIVPVFSIWWSTEGSHGHFGISVFGIRRKLNLSGFPQKKTEIKIKKSHKFKFSFHRFIAVIRSFKIKKCFVNIDTGDMPLNGLLFPMMYTLSGITGKAFRINFFGKTEIVLTIKNNVFRMLRAYINNNQKQINYENKF